MQQLGAQNRPSAGPRLRSGRASKHARKREIELHVVQEERQVVPGTCRPHEYFGDRMSFDSSAQPTQCTSSFLFLSPASEEVHASMRCSSGCAGAPGKQPASVMPSSTRMQKNCARVRTAAVHADTTPQASISAASQTGAPTRVTMMLLGMLATT